MDNYRKFFIARFSNLVYSQFWTFKHNYNGFLIHFNQNWRHFKKNLSVLPTQPRAFAIFEVMCFKYVVKISNKMKKTKYKINLVNPPVDCCSHEPSISLFGKTVSSITNLKPGAFAILTILRLYIPLNMPWWVEAIKWRELNTTVPAVPL